VSIAPVLERLFADTAGCILGRRGPRIRRRVLLPLARFITRRLAIADPASPSTLSHTASRYSNPALQ
jgi:hypothetical protein